MARHKLPEISIVLPWEQRMGPLRWLGHSHARSILAVLAVLGLLAWMGLRESRQAGIRSTRATMLTVRRAIDSFRADQSRCPSDLAELQKRGYLAKVPSDGWERPFRLACPGRFDPGGYELVSDGPDGEPEGLDRIE